MTPLHPHWHSDDSAEEVVPVSVDSVSAPVAEAPQPAIRTASRKPAAVVGILMVAAFGYTVFANSGSLSGQVSTDTATASLHLTADGAVPATLQVMPGTTVEITNDDGIPHVLSFETLKKDGKAIETSPIFPGDTLKMLVPQTTAPGTYSYASKTSPLTGLLVIGSPVAAVSSSSAQSSSFMPVAAPLADVTPDETVLTPTDNAVLPVNFHTVGTSGQAPVEPLHTGAPSNIIMQHKPVTNASSGPATWILVFAASALVLAVTRKAFR